MDTKEAMYLYLYYAGNWNKQAQTEFYEKKALNPHSIFVDFVQLRRKYLADSNDIITDWAAKGLQYFLLSQLTQ